MRNSPTASTVSVSTLDSQGPNTLKLKKGKPGMPSKLGTSIQRLTRNTASSIARMKPTKHVAPEQESNMKQGRVGGGYTIGMSSRTRPKEESIIIGKHDQPQDFISDFENQTDLQGHDRSRTESYRSVCMACNRQIRRKSTTSLGSQHDNPHLLHSTPSSPIPTYYGPLKRRVEEEELEWQAQFTALTNTFIAHSESLEKVSLDLLKSESKVRSLLVTEHYLEDKYSAQEQLYERELIEYNNTLKRQQALLDNLDDLLRDIYSKQDTPDDSSAAASSQSVTFAIKLRWQIYQIIGGTAGTGQVIKEPTAHDKGDLIVTGTGVLLEKKAPRYHEFALYLNPATIQDKYQMKLRCNWVPDIEITQCQYVIGAQTAQPHLCGVKFGWYQRRHHCRSCGKIFCSQHSANRLLLVCAPEGSTSLMAEWSRVCNACFYKLAILPSM